MTQRLTFALFDFTVRTDRISGLTKKANMITEFEAVILYFAVIDDFCEKSTNFTTIGGRER